MVLSRPGRPKWTAQTSPARFCSSVDGAWSVDMWVSTPSRSRRHISSSSASVRARAGGVNLRSAPCSWTSSSRSRKYCGQPSAASRAPRARSSRTYDATSALLTWATAARAPVRRTR